MPDMICPLLEIPPMDGLLDTLRGEGIVIRRANPWQKHDVLEFIREHFRQGWVDETEVAFSRQPVTCYVAYDDERVIGFADYECTRRDYFGPTGVDPAYRGRGVGKALFLAALHGLRSLGYSYAIIGGAGPVDFYARVAGAAPVPFENQHGIYRMAEDPALSDLK